MTEAADDPRVADIVQAGVLRLGLFLPQFTGTPGGEVTARGPGIVADTLMGGLADDLNVTLRLAGQPSPPKSMEALLAGEVDTIFIGIEEKRKTLAAFTAPVMQFDYAYLVPAGSPITESAEVDRPGRRISAVGGHASTLTLEQVTKQAEIVYSEVPQDAFALFRDGGADVFAVPRPELFGYAETLPGSRILTDGFGYNRLGFAVAKDRPGLLEVIDAHVAKARAAGLVARTLDDAGLSARGITVADAP